jgi:Ni/Fe-hydrogenase 1 B-type cytochrome subunit
METFYKRVYVWEFPVRLTHWLNVLSIVTLGITGYYIGSPFIHAYSADQYIMGWMRFIHFSAAYVFTASVVVRLYWSFAGNAYASWRNFVPHSAEQSMGMIHQMMFYSFLSDKPRFVVGHNPLAGLYYLVMMVMFLTEILTGFSLYSLSNPGGFYSSLLGWMFVLFNIQTVRFIHHLIMWVLVYFVMVHIYISFYLDSYEKSGLVGSIFTGYKSVHRDVKIKS